MFPKSYLTDGIVVIIIGKLSFQLPFKNFVERQMEQNSMDLLNVQIFHLDVVANLPLHHRDPFDRLIIAQAIVEQIPNFSFIFSNFAK